MPEFPDPETRNLIEPGCDRCPALVESRTRISWGNGDPDADLVVVGEAPAVGDPGADRWRGGNLTGMAYTSRHSGRRVRDLVADLGFDPAACYFTNAVKCYPSNGAGSNREPTPAERSNCRGHLERELAQVDPWVVLATGKHATLSVLAGEDGAGLDGGFLDAVLEPMDCPGLGVTLVPVLHPSYQDVWLSRLGYEYDEYVAEMIVCVTEVIG